MKKNVLLLGALFVTFHAFGSAQTPKDMAISRLRKAQSLFKLHAANPVQLQNLNNQITNYLQGASPELLDEVNIIKQEPKLNGAYARLQFIINAKLNPAVPMSSARRRLDFGQLEQEMELSDDELSVEDDSGLAGAFWIMDLE